MIYYFVILMNIDIDFLLCYNYQVKEKVMLCQQFVSLEGYKYILIGMIICHRIFMQNMEMVR